jgi:glycosyltransferase involved in cell wall biosynthesis
MSLRRNQPCPCGSGKRYKDCHGVLATDDVSGSAGLEAVLEELAAGNTAGAEHLCGRVLGERPHHPEALRLRSQCLLRRGKIDAALRDLVHAVKSPELVAQSRPIQQAIWTDLSAAFMKALSGLDVAVAAAKRREYWQWRDALASKQSDALPLVSVVCVLGNGAAEARPTLESVYQQTYRNIELVIVSAAHQSESNAFVADLLEGCLFACRTLVLPEASEAALINAGVRASTGAFVNVLPAGDTFDATRVAAMVAGIANRGLAWGFASVEFVADGGGPLSANSPVVLDWQKRFAAIADAPTVGYSFIDQACMAVSAGNLFFSRALFDELAGFRDLPHTCVWDFCLRALWLAEPSHIPRPLYRHTVGISDLQAPAHAAFEAAQLAVFGEFYARACSEEAVPANRFAPSIRYWRMNLLKTAFAAGHALALPVDRLESLAETIGWRRAAQFAAEPRPGVNLVGLPFGELGLGESLRQLAKACSAGGIPFAVRDVDIRLATRQADDAVAPHIADEMNYRCFVFCVNPDMFWCVHRLIKSAVRAGRYKVGYWYWELDQVPREWGDTLERVDETWAATEFIADTMRRATSKPVFKVPPPIEVVLSRPYARAEFRLPEGRFLYLFSFDFNSYFKRKNPEGVILSFKRAFPGHRRDVGLVIKSVNGDRHPDRLREMQELVAGDDRVVVIDRFLGRDQVYGLQSVTDAFVSLHRSEGFGLGLAEAMYLGKPVIATAYSGNLEFMNEHNSCLVDYSLIPVKRGEYLYDDDRFRWADPDIDQAAQYMGRLVDDADYRGQLAERGRRDIRTRFTRENTAALMRQRLQELGLL